MMPLMVHFFGLRMRVMKMADVFSELPDLSNVDSVAG
jgi:hypothetical protein